MMRVTDKMTTGTFLTNNRRLRSNLLGSYTRIMTQRRFNRVSEDSINGAKAMIIRRDLRDLDIYDSNLSSIKQLFTEAESSLTQIAHKNYISVEEQLVAATNGTHDQMEMNIFATTLDQIADSMVNTLNADFSERQIFGGTNNSTPPFEIGRYCVTDENDTVIYPPYFYDYYVGAEATQNQIADANEALAKLAEHNTNGTSAEEKDFVSMTQTLKKLNVEVGVNEDGKYTATVTTDNGKGDKITILLPDGTHQDFVYGEGENPVIAEVEAAAANITANGAVSKADAEALAKLNLTAEVDDAGTVTFKDSKGIIVNMAGGLPAEIKDKVPKEITVSVGTETVSKQIENEVKSQFEMVDVPRSITYNGIPVDFDVMHKMTDANGNKFDIQIGSKYTIKKLNDDFTWSEGTEIAPNVEAAVKGRNNSLIFPGSDPVYVDIGIGMKYDKDNDYKVDPQTALDTAFNGAAIMGCGLDDDGYSKNLVQLVLDAARALRNGDQSTPNAIIDKANKANNNVIIEIANIGSKQNSIEFYEQRNEDSRYNLRERQNIVEGTDMETEISYWESLRAAYEASLKVGTQVIPNSIFNYI
ncbi:MAG: hypothetical protein K2H90_01565 [Oscillospiraceae bacterium]|nr:hypothetical protein [Oscillospiraceae bacterium]